MENRQLELSLVAIKYIEAINDGFKYLVSVGSTRSTKTYSACQLMHIKCTKNDSEIGYAIGLTHSITEQNLVNTFKEIMGVDKFESMYNGQKRRLKYPSGSVIYFETGGEKNSENKFTGKKSTMVLIDEGNLMPELAGILKQLGMRSEGWIILTFNPSRRVEAIESLMGNPKSVRIHSTYKDNEHLSQELIDDLEYQGSVNERFRKVYLEGIYAPNPEGSIFKNWEITNEWPENYKWKSFGNDFGWSDPNTLVEARWYDEKLYVRCHLYKNKMTNDEIYKVFHKAAGRNLINSESAEPKTIAYLASKGLNIVGVKKGPGSIVSGLKSIQNVKMMVYYDEPNMIREAEDYAYKKVNGEYTDIPEDKNNHAIGDALRYAVLDHLEINKGKYNYR